jgi:hypothetical protein
MPEGVLLAGDEGVIEGSLIPEIQGAVDADKLRD